MKLPYFCHLIGRAESLDKTLVLVKIEGKRKRRKAKQKGTAEDEMVRQHY